MGESYNDEKVYVYKRFMVIHIGMLVYIIIHVIVVQTDRSVLYN